MQEKSALGTTGVKVRHSQLDRNWDTSMRETAHYLLATADELEQIWYSGSTIVPVLKLIGRMLDWYSDSELRKP